MPAAESFQMEGEYRDQKQGKFEDVQNYINSVPKCSSPRLGGVLPGDDRAVPEQVCARPDVLL